MGFDPIKEKEKRIAFVQAVNTEKMRVSDELEILLATFEKQLKIDPQTSFSFTEIASLLKEIKKTLIKVNEQAYARLSVEGIKGLPFDTIIDELEDLDAKIVVEGLKATVKELEDQIRGGKFVKPSPSFEAEIQKLESKIVALENEKERLLSELNLKDRSIETLNESIKRMKEEQVQLRGKTTTSARQSVELEEEIDSLKSELEVKETRLTLLEDKQISLGKKIDELRTKNLELERLKGELELKIVDIDPSMEEYNREINKLNWELKAEISKTESLKKSNEELNERLTSAEEELSKYRTIADKLRRSLEENIKYRVIFLLQDLQAATFEDLGKILAIKSAAVMALVRTLEKEDWIEVNGETITLKKTLT